MVIVRSTRRPGCGDAPRVDVQSVNDRETRLIARVLAYDDRHAFGELVRQHQSAVRGFLRRLTGGRHALADDLAQETFVEAYRNLGRFHGESSFAAWLFGIAYNRFRSSRRRQRETVEWSGEVALPDAVAGHDTTISAAPATVDLQQDLAAALARLSADERSAIHLCYAEGLTHEEAAGVLGCPLGTLKTHVLRAKDKLRVHLRVWATA
jgi:RNA polymerase sigma-70 factor (ECF subfamily)